MKAVFYNFVFFLIFLVTTRLIPHPPNFTPILASAILAPQLFQKKLYTSIFLVIFAMLISDIFLGLHKFLFFTYIPLIIITILSSQIQKFKFNLILMTLSAPLIFFIISNFGVWLIGNYYTKDINGLLQCYTLALPFLKNSFISTIFFISLYIILYNLMYYLISKFYDKSLSSSNSLVYFNILKKL